MRTIYIIYFLLTSFSFSQSDICWIYFTDKDCDSSISLSQYSQNKRLIKNIPIDFYDYAICESYVEIIKSHDIKIRRTSRWLNAVSVEIKSQMTLDSLLSYDFVRQIKPLLKLVPETKDLPNKFHKSNNLLRVNSGLSYGLSSNQIDMLGGLDLHNLGFLGSGINIAVFDAGFIGVESLPIFNNLSPMALGVAPPTPLSTSSKIRVLIVLSFSITSFIIRRNRDNSPPDAISEILPNFVSLFV